MLLIMLLDILEVEWSGG